MSKILIASSGGVDSSVSAALAMDQGYEVETAIFIMRGVDEEARDSAQAVAQHLGVTHHECDVREEFDDLIVTYFVDEYKNGRTPNPCMICNEKIKMGTLLEKANKLKCDHVTTGHYARIKMEHGRYILKRGIDRNEQSYFLYRLRQCQLKDLLLLLGDMTRAEVEAYARKRDLPSVRRQKSQDVCFVPGNDYPLFIKDYMTFRPGPIQDRRGKVLGEHKGIAAYTIGQRRGLGISASHPLYVFQIDAENNVIIVGEEKDLYASAMIASDTNFIPFDTLEERMEVCAKPRYVSALSPAVIEPINEKDVKVIFSEPQWALTPGQSVVFYRDDVLVGGGVIQQVP